MQNFTYLATMYNEYLNEINNVEYTTRKICRNNLIIKKLVRRKNMYQTSLCY